MDVVCERCQTEYEFDDALVSERGTTVKCTNCGHQFKIYRPASATSAGGTGSWSLRRPDGTTITFDSLAVLQKWIIEGRVTRLDQISRNGEGWKPLGSIAELESFFATAELRTNTMRGGTMSGAGGPRKPPSMPPPPLPPGRSHRPPPTPASAAAPTTSGTGTLRPGAPSTVPATSMPPPSAGLPALPPAPRTPTLGGHERGRTSNGASATASPGFSMGGATGGAADADGFEFGEATGIVEQWNDRKRPAVGAPPPSPPANATAPTVAVRRPPPTPPPTAQIESPPPPGRRVAITDAADELPTMSRSPKGLDLPAPPPRRGSGALIGAGAGVLLTLVGVAIAWQLHLFGGARPAAVTAPPPDDHVGDALARTATQTRTATRGVLDEATGELTALLASDPNEPRLHAARAEALALMGEQTRQRADDLDARAAAGGPDAASQRAEAALSRRDAATTLERATQDVSTAEANASRVTRALDRVRLHAALGEATRVLGDMSAARRHLEGGRAAGGGPDIDLLTALLARDEGNAEAAIEALRALAARPETRVRAHLALGRLLASRGDAAGARAEADAVTRELPGDDEARALAQAIDARQPPFRSTAAPSPVLAAGAADAAVVAHPTPPARPDAGAAVAAEGSGGGLAGRSYDSLIAEGDRLAEHGQHDRARAAYNAAIALRPDASEAIAGLGWVELDGGSATLAINHFRHALSINSRYSEAYIGLGEAYASLNDFASALRAYRQYLDVNPDGSRASMAQRQIQQIQLRLAAPAGGTTAPAGSDNGANPPPAPAPAGGSGTAAPSEPAPAPSGGSNSSAAPAPAGGP